MVKKAILSIGLISCIFFVFNEISAQISCGIDDYLHRLEQNDPEQKARIEAALSTIREKKADGIRKSTGKITIPVVVHVIYHNVDENISDQQIHSQMEVLNKDFQRLNEDTFRTNKVFKDIAGSLPVEFRLAVRDPEGNPSTGITRTYTEKLSFGPGDNYAADTAGGKTGWPADQYMNIWVCNLQYGAVLGAATMPGSDFENDGIVVKYIAFGTVGNVDVPNDYGRTATHEVGHWLGLEHTFKDGCSGTTFTDCSTSGDYICDTPPTAVNNNCGSGLNSCTENPKDNPDQIENYMDYANDRCSNMFTKGQVEVMQSTFDNFRIALKTSQGAVPVTNNDAGIGFMAFKGEVYCGGSFTPKVKLTNYGATPLQSAKIICTNQSGTILEHTWSGNLASLQSEFINLNNITVSPGKHQLKFYTEKPNNTADEFADNDTAVIMLEVKEPNAMPLPFFEDFEAAIFPPISWSKNNPDISVSWSLQTMSLIGIGGTETNAAHIKYHHYDIMGEDDDLVSPMLSFEGSSSPHLSFAYSFAPKSNAEYLNYAKLQVLITTNCGDYIVVDELKGDELLTYATSVENEWRPQNGQYWKTHHINLSQFAGSKAKIVFRAWNGLGNNLYIDNVKVEDRLSSVESYSSNQTIKVYPNPTKGDLLNISFLEHAQNAEITIYNVLGKVVYNQKNIDGFHHKITLADMENGVYLIKINSGRQNKLDKILIQH